MPRQARLDAPGTLHHVMARGIERGKIFRDPKDYEEFIGRLEKAIKGTGTEVLAWSLLPNHFHLLLRSGDVGLSTVMRRLMTGYVVWFNLRHRRHGHLFQNRYKSVVCEEEVYLLELVRYIHLNGLRARVVRTLDELGGHRGHSCARVLAVVSARAGPFRRPNPVQSARGFRRIPIARFGGKPTACRRSPESIMGDARAQELQAP